MNIFFSYTHDENSFLAKRLKKDLEARGHTVWFDEAEIKTGDDWRSMITRGILDSDSVVAFLSKHSMRDPGVCLNEIAIAIAMAEKGDEAIVRVLVEPERVVNAFVSITHIQWLTMDEHLSRADDENWYRTKIEQLVEVIERPGSLTKKGELDDLRNALHPLSFNADIGYHLPRFTGRAWLVKRYKDWLAMPSPGNANKVFRIEGGPGMGKTAVASYLVHTAKSSVIGIHLCKSGSAVTHDPAQLVLSLAYQMASRMPDYRARLLRVPYVQELISAFKQRQEGTTVSQKEPSVSQEDAGSLWDKLIKEPLVGAGGVGLIDRQRMAIVIDGLDEATKNGQNEIVKLLVTDRKIETLPAWIGLVLTGRPDPELVNRLKAYTPQVIDGDDPANLDDLRHYIDAWLNEEQQAGRLQAHQVAPVTHALLQKSEGVFLYLVQLREEAQQSRLSGSTGFDLTKPVTLPNGLNNLYQISFERRFPDVDADPDNPITRWNALVKPLLGAILASSEPLPLDLARELMSWDQSEDEDGEGDEQQHKALQALGSLIRRSGNEANPETCTLAPFHNSVREWLSSEASGHFRIFPKKTLYSLTEATWKRYVQRQEDDAYAWQVLPDMLPKLADDSQDKLLGALTWDTSQVLFRLANSLEFKLRYTEAAATFGVQARFSERLSNSAPENAEFANGLNISYNKLGKIQQAMGNSQAAIALYQQALEIRQRLFNSAPENPPFARGLSISYNMLGRMLHASGNNQEALAMYKQALEIRKRLFNSAPENAEFACSLSFSYSKLGDMQKALGNSQAAIALYQQGLEITQRLYNSEPENAEFACDLWFSYGELGNMQRALGNNQAALALFQQGLEIKHRLYNNAPENAEFACNLWLNYGELANLQQAQGNNQAALAMYQQGLEIAERLSNSAPENAQFASDLSLSYDSLGNMQNALGNNQEALAMYQQALEIRQRLFNSDPENAQFARDLSISYNNLGNIQHALDNSQAANAL